MSLITRLISEDMVSFVDVLIENYAQLKLDETNVIILIHLFKQKKSGGNFLSPKTLAKKMNITADQCSNRIVDLVENGFIEFEFSSKSGKETFNLNPTLNKLERLFDQEEKLEKKQEVNQEVKTIIQFVEQEYHRPLTSYELDIINVWVLEEKHTQEDIKRALLESLKAKKTSLRYVDMILINQLKNKHTVSDLKKDEELEMIINQVYAKKK
jgi:DNA replication protein